MKRSKFTDRENHSYPRTGRCWLRCAQGLSCTGYRYLHDGLYEGT